MKDDNTAQFKVTSNGPLQVSGNFELFDSSGELITRQGPLFLCRCGMSSDKPFCDGSHKTSGFSG
ncbi:MAG: CDGSH iron-sulfur domain-containing protein [Bacteroidales bacterium]